MQRDIRVIMTTGSLALAAMVAGSFLNVTAGVLAPAELLALGAEGGTFLFIDWLLPTMSGLQLIQMLRRRLAGRTFTSRWFSRNRTTPPSRGRWRRGRTITSSGR